MELERGHARKTWWYDVREDMKCPKRMHSSEQMEKEGH